jgi:hypothetical protein
MKKLCILFFLGICLHGSAQITKGSWVAGVQTTLLNGDFYNTYPAFSSAGNGKERGFNLIPSVYYGIATNWLAGLEVYAGYNSLHDPLVSGGKNSYRYFDLGIAPVTRYYLNISKNGYWKLYGLAGAALVNNHVTTVYTYGQSGTNHIAVTALAGAGAAYAGKRYMVDAGISVTGIHMGVYRVFQLGKPF